MTAEQAVALIQDGDTLTVCGCGSNMVPEQTLTALEQRFIDSGHPRDLVVANPIVVGKEQGTGLEHFAAPGMVIKLVGSTYSLWEKPRLSERIVDGEVEAYVYPMGVLEEGIFDKVVLTTEHGAIGGVPESRKIFGVHHNPDVLIRSLGMFALYDGGGLDITYLGFAQLDRAGNVNVSKFGRTLPGCGSFIDITHNVKRIVFCATFTSGGLKTRVRDGRIEILQEGRNKKLVPQVEQITFSAKNGHEKGQTVFYVTERAVFRLGPAGVELVEIAPGIDLKRDILPHVGFELTVPPDLKEMDARLFQAAPLALAQAWSRSA